MNNETTKSVTNNVSQSILIDPTLHASLIHALDMLVALYQEVNEKAHYIKNKSDALDAITKDLKEKKIISIGANVEEALAKSLNDYFSLSSILAQEIKSHCDYYKRYFEPNSEDKKQDEAQEEQRPLNSLTSKDVKLIMSYVKNRKKDLMVVFSRYDHGISNRLKQLQKIQESITKDA